MVLYLNLVKFKNLHVHYIIRTCTTQNCSLTTQNCSLYSQNRRNIHRKKNTSSFVIWPAVLFSAQPTFLTKSGHEAAPPNGLQAPFLGCQPMQQNWSVLSSRTNLAPMGSWPALTPTRSWLCGSQATFRTGPKSPMDTFNLYS